MIGQTHDWQIDGFGDIAVEVAIGLLGLYFVWRVPNSQR